MPEAIIALGANLGQPVEALRSAVQALGRTDGIRVLGTSRFYTTSPRRVFRSRLRQCCGAGRDDA